MASPTVEHLRCAICFQLFEDPVALPCAHNFCRACVRQHWQQKGERLCPMCCRRCSSMDIISNLALGSACRAFSEPESEELCGEHKEKLKLFCLDHREPVCLVCRDGTIHAGHKFLPLHEVAQGQRKKLLEGLQEAKAKLDDYSVIRDECHEQAAHIELQGEQVKSKIKKDFQELRGFLLMEEEARLSAVKKEEQKKSRMMRDKMEALERDMAALADAIRSTEELLTLDHVSFVDNFQDAMARIQVWPWKPELLRAALLDEAQHVGNVKFSAWQRMKEAVSFSPVILDPNTAAPGLALSEDLTCVAFKVRRQRPKNPERFKWNIVLGSALASGTHVWDVEVGDNKDWQVGVAWGDPSLPGSMQLTTVAFAEGKYKRPSSKYAAWNPSGKLERLRVHVDTNKRYFAFYDSLTSAKIYKGKKHCALPHLSANVKICPYFYTTDRSPLRIIPLPHDVTTEVP